MTIALKEIHISNEKKRDASVRFVSLIKENDPKLSYKGKSIKNSRLLISSDETSEESLIQQYKSKLAENILNNYIINDELYNINLIKIIKTLLSRDMGPIIIFKLDPVLCQQLFIALVNGIEAAQNKKYPYHYDQEGQLILEDENIPAFFVDFSGLLLERRFCCFLVFLLRFL